jgi:hypothetical protein
MPTMEKNGRDAGALMPPSREIQLPRCLAVIGLAASNCRFYACSSGSAGRRGVCTTYEFDKARRLSLLRVWLFAQNTINPV